MTLSAAGIARVKRVLIAPFPIPLRSNIYGNIQFVAVTFLSVRVEFMK